MSDSGSRSTTERPTPQDLALSFNQRHPWPAVSSDHTASEMEIVLIGSDSIDAITLMRANYLDGGVGRAETPTLVAIRAIWGTGPASPIDTCVDTFAGGSGWTEPDTIASN